MHCREMSRAVGLVIAAGVPCAMASQALAQGPLSEPFPADFDLGVLEAALGGDGSLGFVALELSQDPGASDIDGVPDMNGDGLGELAIAANASPYDNTGGYVLFGDADRGAQVDVSAVDGTNGFRVRDTTAYSTFGFAASSAGDLNGDGFGDVAFGAPGNYSYDPYGYGGYASQEDSDAYVIFGTGGAFPAEISARDVGRSQPGVRLQSGTFPGSYSGVGFSLGRAGDVDGDGVDDLIVGAPTLKPGIGGEGYVVLGDATLSGSENIGSVSARIFTDRVAEKLGTDVSGIGDVNGDGFDDVALTSRVRAFRTYIVFGGPTLLDDVDVDQLDGTNGFELRGFGDITAPPPASVGDINGDGVDDFVAPRGRYADPATFIVFGRTDGFPERFEPVAGVDGVSLTNRAQAVAGGQDVNGDGLPDLVAIGTDFGAGGGFVLYGSDDGLPAEVGPDDLDGTNGFRINWPAPTGFTGISVAMVGDMNGDGVSEIVVRAQTSRIAGSFDNAYVVYGRSGGAPCRADLDGDGDLTLFDFLAFQNLFDAGDPVADFDGDGSLTIFDFLAFQNAFDAGCP